MINAYDISNGDTQSAAIDTSNGYLYMEIDATAISSFITVQLEYSPDGGTDWFPYREFDVPFSASPFGVPAKKVFEGTTKFGWQVDNISVDELRQKVVVGSGKTGTLTIVDDNGAVPTTTAP